MELNYGDHRPLYEQIKEKTKEYIVSGIFGEHERLPSVREVAAELAINPNTIQRAYKELESEGYIYSQKAKGYFVAPVELAVGDSQRKKMMGDFSQLVKELKYIDADKAELIAIVENIYKEG
jgi:GntR family transcriptional regulator